MNFHDPPEPICLVVTKWYASAKWLLERVESFPKSLRFILGQRLANHVALNECGRMVGGLRKSVR